MIMQAQHYGDQQQTWGSRDAKGGGAQNKETSTKSRLRSFTNVAYLVKQSGRIASYLSIFIFTQDLQHETEKGVQRCEP